MAEPSVFGNETGCFKEAVCVNVSRIYDSCSDKDCLEDLQVMFTNRTQPIIDNAMTIKVKKVEVLDIVVDVEAIPFNRGYYSVDMTYFFRITLSSYTSINCHPTEICGLAVFTKKVILYGSEGSIKIFSSKECGCEHMATNLPEAVIEVADPLVLESRLVECHRSCEPCHVPTHICGCFEGDFCSHENEKHVLISIGLFTIVQLERKVQMLIPAYDFCMPDKECSTSISDEPCELFKKIKFPVNEFFPPKLSDYDCDCICDNDDGKGHHRN